MRKILRNKTDEASKAELEKVEHALAEKCAKSNYDKIMDEIKDIDCEDGGVNIGNLWKLKRKLSPKCRDPPTAMMDGDGNLVTSPHLIESLALETFSRRLKNRPMKKELIRKRNKNIMINKINEAVTRIENKRHEERKHKWKEL